MLPAPEIYGILLFLASGPIALVAWAAWGKRDRPGGRWFVLTLLGMIGWSVGWGCFLFFDGYDATLYSFNAVLLFVNVTVIGWFFTAAEFTRQRKYGQRVVAPFLAIPLATQVVVWTNPMHGLFWLPGTTVDAYGVLHPSFGPWFAVHIAYSYLLMLASGVLLLATAVEQTGLYRKQTAVLLVGWSVPIATSVLFVADVFPTDYLNPTPIAFIIGTGIWGWGLFRYRLLETLPIARRTALEEMDEGVLVVDDRAVVRDANPAVRTVLGLDADPSGESLDSVLGDHPELADLLADGPVTDATATISIDGDPRHLTVDKSRISQGDGPHGDVLVFSDQTPLIRYEEDLELLKAVLARVLRHDVRNRMNVIRAHGELITNREDGQAAEDGRTIVRATDQVIETAAKAQAIESIVEAERRRYDVDLVDAVEKTVSWARNQYPDAVVETDLPAEAWIEGDEEVPLAVRSLVENAVVHNDAESPWVRVSVEVCPDSVTLVVTDDGPGMPDQERAIFERREIDPLNHSTGLGLWLVDWVVRNSGGDLDIQVTETGTRVVAAFQRRADESTDPPA